MAFGTTQSDTPAQTEDDRWELRTLGFTEGDNKTTKSGKAYWRVKDGAGKWYSVWEASVYASIEIAANNGDQIPCAVHITPGTNGGNPFYTISAVNAAAEPAVKEGTIKSQSSRAPGGKNSEYNRRMHPDDTVRVTILNCLEKAERMAEFTYTDAPEDVTREQWMYAKVPEYREFFSQQVKLPVTHQPEPEEAAAPAAGFQGSDPA